MNKIVSLILTLNVLIFVNCASDAPAEQKPKAEESQGLEAEVLENETLKNEVLEAEPPGDMATDKELDDSKTQDSSHTNQETLKKLRSQASESLAPTKNDLSQDEDLPQESKDQRGGTVITTNN